jgi:hypothetical protein
MKQGIGENRHPINKEDFILIPSFQGRNLLEDNHDKNKVNDME